MGVGRPDLTATAGPSRRVCHSHGICGLASTATSRCRSVRPGCPYVQGPRIEPKEGAPSSRTASPSPPTAHRLHPRPVANLAPRGQPNVESQRRWGGSTPTTPLLSVRGCKWGSTPLGSISHQILEGTCGKGASSSSRPGGTPGWLWNLCPGNMESAGTHPRSLPAHPSRQSGRPRTPGLDLTIPPPRSQPCHDSDA